MKTSQHNDAADLDTLARIVTCVEIAGSFVTRLSPGQMRDILAKEFVGFLDSLRRQHRLGDKWLAKRAGAKRPDCRRSYSAQTTKAEADELYRRHVANHEPIEVANGRRVGSVITYNKSRQHQPISAFDALMNEQREYAARQEEDGSCDS